MLRIVAGEHGGRRLQAPRDSDTRPTSEKVREALFSILGPIDGAVLDLYAGSGALGIEALSRGASRAVFVESRRPALQALEANLASLALNDRAEVIPRPVERAASSLADRGPFALILADPPYALVDRPGGLAALEALSSLLEPGGVLMLEHASRSTPPAFSGLTGPETRRYGDTSLSFYESAAGS